MSQNKTAKPTMHGTLGAIATIPQGDKQCASNSSSTDQQSTRPVRLHRGQRMQQVKATSELIANTTHKKKRKPTSIPNSIPENPMAPQQAKKQKKSSPITQAVAPTNIHPLVHDRPLLSLVPLPHQDSSSSNADEPGPPPLVPMFSKPPAIHIAVTSQPMESNNDHEGETYMNTNTDTEEGESDKEGNYNGEEGSTDGHLHNKIAYTNLDMAEVDATTNRFEEDVENLSNEASHSINVLEVYRSRNRATKPPTAAKLTTSAAHQAANSNKYTDKEQNMAHLQEAENILRTVIKTLQTQGSGVSESSITREATIVVFNEAFTWRSKMKTMARPIVKSYFNNFTDEGAGAWTDDEYFISNQEGEKACIAQRVKTLLKTEDVHSDPKKTPRSNLNHPAIKELVLEFFYSRDGSEAKMWPKLFESMVPERAVALAATCISRRSQRSSHWFMYLYLIGPQL
ncbi:hypothetical protein NP233_g6645 [Leucocoprinus birnbaumii]|uniref:DUF6532 domain-containing protein n=1 Tax=Leucocoprinus birnbaumii TaxID=56174 RepID=A0AAD5VQN3_9AGAR|nr:hypothetical protein NP233_g6645 [Leucocoprinus birnbaumii]